MSSPLPPPAPLPGETPAAPARASSTDEIRMLRALSRLDGALDAYRRAQLRPPLVRALLRLLRGITAHFRLRLGEWFAAIFLLQFGLILHEPASTFALSPAFHVMAARASEERWALACLAVAVVHLGALVVNGTYVGFRWSPHIRALASFLAIALWSQIALDLWQGALPGSPTIGTARLLLFLELFNFVQACRDTGAVDERRARNVR